MSGLELGLDTITKPDVSTSDEVDLDRDWRVVVWNDPINLISYVIYVLRLTFGYSLAKATELTMEVHNNGRSIVSSGPREKAEVEAHTLHGYGLWATLERDT
ncbi:MAG: ATP-dependent Clp protease adapter ClpS [Actinomycetota bacterium]|nr:ATP-dependent Clp protease adapter ClpS [Actinomycetota bacterium]